MRMNRMWSTSRPFAVSSAHRPWIPTMFNKKFFCPFTQMASWTASTWTILPQSKKMSSRSGLQMRIGGGSAEENVRETENDAIKTVDHRNLP